MNNLSYLIEKLQRLTSRKVILREAKVDDYYNKYVVQDKVINSKQFDVLKTLDEPPYVYLPYLIKRYKEGLSIKLLNNFLIAFKQIKDQLSHKDIYSYVSPVDMNFVINKASLASTKGELNKVNKSTSIGGTSGVEKLGSENNIDLYWIKTESAAKKYGSGTKWCIAAEHGNMFSSYTKQGYNGSFFYFIIDKNKTKEDKFYKVALQVEIDPQYKIDKKTGKRIIVDYNIEKTYWDATDESHKRYKLPPGLNNIISDNLKKIGVNAEAIKQAQELTSTLTKQTNKLATKETKLLEPVQYLIKGERVPLAIENTNVLDVRHTEIKSLMNLKSCTELLASGCTELESLGDLTEVKDLGDFRNCPNITSYNKLKTVGEAYINSNTNKQFVGYLKQISKNIVEL